MIPLVGEENGHRYHCRDKYRYGELPGLKTHAILNRYEPR
jgi:hypothetical protein